MIRMKRYFLLMVQGQTPTTSELLRHLPAGAVLQELPAQKQAAALKNTELYLDEAQHCLRKGGRQILLTPAEYKLVCLLAAQPGRVWGKEQLYWQLWQQGGGTSARAIWNLIYRLRRKLEADPATPQYLRTAGGGYQLILKP